MGYMMGHARIIGCAALLALTNHGVLDMHIHIYTLFTDLVQQVLGREHTRVRNFAE